MKEMKTPENMLARGKGHFQNCTDYDDAVEAIKEYAVLYHEANSPQKCNVVEPCNEKYDKMIGNFKIITLCGSTKFKDQFYAEQKRLTLEGNIVISLGCFGHSGDIFNDTQRAMLDDMHKRKIDLADEIFVINVGGYIGSSTKDEIQYAQKTNKPVNYYINEPCNYVSGDYVYYEDSYSCPWVVIFREITNGSIITHASLSLDTYSHLYTNYNAEDSAEFCAVSEIIIARLATPKEHKAMDKNLLDEGMRFNGSSLTECGKEHIDSKWGLKIRTQMYLL